MRRHKTLVGWSLFGLLLGSSYPAAAAALSVEVVVFTVSKAGPGGALDEFVEVRNLEATTQEIGGMTVWACSAVGSPTLLATIPEGAVLEGARGMSSYLLANAAGYSGATPPDQFYTGDIQREGGVALFDDSPSGAARVDAVGVTLGSECTEGAPAVAGDYLTRWLGTDTDNNAVDFSNRESPLS